MTEDKFKSLKPGDRVYYNGSWAIVDKWLEPNYMVQYTNGTNTKLSDPWLNKMILVRKGV